MESSESRYYNGLDHLRLIAAMLVLFWHTLRHMNQVPSVPVPSFWPLSFAQEGHTGVALFMVLSGFIFWLLCRSQSVDYIQFLRNRFLRIAPLFLFWTFLYFYISDIDPVRLLVAVFGLLNKGTIPGVGWTIVVEFQFYLLFPFLLIFARKYGIRYLVGLVVLAIGVRLSIWLVKDSVQDLAYSTIFGRIDQFLMGMIFCELFLKYRRVFRSIALLVTVVAIWTLVFHFFDKSGGYFDGSGGMPSKSPIWIYWPTFEGIFWGAITACYMGGAERLIPRKLDRGMAWMGALSYSLYLNHPYAIYLSHKAFSYLNIDMTSFKTALLMTVVGVLPLLVIMSLFTFYLIERPFLLLRKRYLSPLPVV